jgi:hypothetical protein
MKIAPIMLLVSLATSVAAYADDTPPAPSPEIQQAARKACRADAIKLCPGKRGREALACLRGSADKVSAECKDALAKLPQPTSS